MTSYELTLVLISALLHAGWNLSTKGSRSPLAYALMIAAVTCASVVVVLPFFEVGSGRVAIVGSRGGMPSDPHWARNLRAEPRARVHLRRREHRVRTRVAAGEERASLWKEIVERSPIYAQYQQRAGQHGREIPVFVVEREDGQPLSSGQPQAARRTDDAA